MDLQLFDLPFTTIANSISRSRPRSHAGGLPRGLTSELVSRHDNLAQKRSTKITKRAPQRYRAHIVNYADDFVILSRGKAEEARKWTQAVMTRLGRTLNEQKTCIRNAKQESFDFLGYTFGPRYWWKTGKPYLAVVV